jgi:ABC-type multidrug transport system ATPase subunit
MRRRDTDRDAGLVVEGLGRSFGDHTVLHDVGFQVPAGTFVVVTGTNGAGKSTLLRCLAGLARHTGHASFAGRRLSSELAHPDRSYLPQQVVLTPSATVAETLELFARLRRVDVSATPLGPGFLPPLDQPLGRLSGGQQQRVAVAATLLGHPRLVLLDEPDANLDPSGCEDLWAALSRLRDAGSVVLVATPRALELEARADGVLALAGGRVAGFVDGCRPECEVVA